jgi:energy-coupling factor transporter ATP-binding protein EcfA2
MDFLVPRTKETRGGILEISPDFVVGRSKDLMVRGRSFYAIWDEAEGLWSTDEYDVQRLVDQELHAFAEKKKDSGISCNVKYLRSFDSHSWSRFQSFLSKVSDNSKELDSTLTFENQETRKSDYVSRRLPYALSPGDITAWDELIGTLYSVEERAKIEWAIGAVVSGDSKKIQKFLVLYGPAGTGKSTVLNIVQKLFEGYTTSFEAKALGSSSNSFSTEVFKNNPLVAIQHDGDLSKIDDNTKLNSIIAHEDMTMNEKYKPSYTARVNAFLFMGTNQPVKISDAKSGIIRRLIDVHPTGVKLPANHYHTLMSQIDFELGAIAHHCLEVYRSMGKNFYNGYRPLEMMLQTDVFFNFIEANYDIFKSQDGTTLKQAYQLYKEFCADTGIERVLPQYKVREELRNYFVEFKDRAEAGGQVVRSYYSGFSAHPFKQPAKEANTFSLVLDETESIFDELAKDYPAQYATDDGIPKLPWVRVKTKLKDIDTKTLHYVKVPENHIVIDFDLKADNGTKAIERNLEAASVWPATYAELSKSGGGVHLHYLYDGDASELATQYSEGIEVKVYTGKSALRRMLTRCNSVPISTINSGLPKKEKKVLPATTIQSEKSLRELIARNLRKEIHPGTKPSIDFIYKILDDAFKSGMTFDVTDLKPKIFAFAAKSSNKSLECLKIVQKMQWVGGDAIEKVLPVDVSDERLVFFDVEVYPNLFVVCWKFQGDDNVVKMINPSAQDIEKLFSLKLVGFNNRRYDNHILYGRYMGYSNEQLYNLSYKLINNDKNAYFGEAYNLSYCDIWDFSSVKQGLKKFEITLGLPHLELDFPWDQSVPEENWQRVVDYCVNDVMATEAVFNDRKGDFIARQILAELSGLSVNDTTQKHTAKIIFGNEKNPQKSFKYVDLATEFPGYSYSFGKSEYRGENPSEGGYVYAEPGVYTEVAVLDVASMHPTSIVQLDHFGPFTEKFGDLLLARLAIKAGDYDSARTMLDGRLEPYLKDQDQAKALSYALKIVINIVYGLTSASFNNPFKDHRNVDNIVAKRGALFMIDLKLMVQEAGYRVVHIKTDSIKIANADQHIIDLVSRFGEKYGYSFDHEATYEKIALVNDAVYIAREGDKWKAVGAQFQHPYVFKTLFTGEEVEFNDLCETKQVQKGAMYLDFERQPKETADVSKMRFVGRVGRFVPVSEDSGQGGILYRVFEEKLYAVTGTKGYSWVEATMADEEDPAIDISYFEKLADDAVKAINKFGNFEEFVGSKM